MLGIEPLLNRDCTIRTEIKTGEIDDYGNEQVAPVNVQTRCALQQRQRSENEAELSDSSWLAFFAPQEVIATDAVVIVDGDRYEVDGAPWLVHDELTAQPHHLEVALRRVAGSED